MARTRKTAKPSKTARADPNACDDEAVAKARRLASYSGMSTDAMQKALAEKDAAIEKMKQQLKEEQVGRPVMCVCASIHLYPAPLTHALRQPRLHGTGGYARTL